MITLQINGKAREADVSPETPLLWTLHDVLGMTGTKAIRPRVLEWGVVDCLFKPFSDAALIGAIHAARGRPG